MGNRARALLIAWLFGVVCALLLTERWRRLGMDRSPAAEPAVGEVDEAATGGFRARVVAPVVTGAKKDVTWAKSTVGRIAHRDEATVIPPSDEGVAPSTESASDEIQPAAG